MSKEERQNGEKKIYKWDPKKRRKEERRGEKRKAEEQEEWRGRTGASEVRGSFLQ